MGSFPEKQNDPKNQRQHYHLYSPYSDYSLTVKTRSNVVMLYLILADLSYGEVNSFRMSKEDGGHRSGRVHGERFC